MKIILASTSPRRIEMLKNLGIVCKVVSPHADETPRKGEKPAALVARLALAKARSVATKLKHGARTSLIISADTIVVEPSGKKILNKPRSTREAFQMLQKLQGVTHTVLTGYCILEIDPDEKKGFAHSHIRIVRSRVTMRALSPTQIRAYIKSGEPMDKAGSYAAQGIGMALIEKINGSYANVVGLPVSQLIRDLEEHFEVRVLG